MNNKTWLLIVILGIFTFACDNGMTTTNNPNNDDIIMSSTGISMTYIPSGTFTMGSPASEKGRYIYESQRQVTMSSFYMSIYQVTQLQWITVMVDNSNGINMNPSFFDNTGRKLYITSLILTTPEPGELQSRRPVESVSWYDALVFCNRLSVIDGLSPAYRIKGSTNPADWGVVPTDYNSTWDAVEIVPGSTGYRLPTEAQWEYACRAGTTTAFNDGNDDWEDRPALNHTSWNTHNSDYKTHEVGKKAANAWGLYDMHGNVYEWCWDWNGDYPNNSQINPTGPSGGTTRIVRGGAWNNNGRGLRSAVRGGIAPFIRFEYIGLRLVRPI